MADQCFDCFLSDADMRAHLESGETLVFKLSKWQEIERQIERLGFEDSHFVTQVSARRGELIKVTPAGRTRAQAVRHAA